MATYTYPDLQNGFYNALTQGLGMTNQDNFQVIQPSPPLLDQTRLFQYFNNIPPESLTQNYISASGNQWLQNYAGLLSALLPTVKVDFKGDIGEDNFKAWQQYLLSQNPIPPVTSQPQLFRSWAMVVDPSVAVKGSSDLSKMLLDPVSTAQMAIMPYQKADGSYKDADFIPGYDNMTAELYNAPSRSFNVADTQANSDVSKTWTHGGNSGFFGLWGGSSSSSSISETFASKSISVQASFKNVTRFPATPGSWYNSSAFGLAYHVQEGNPWDPTSSINWNNTFGPDGNLQRFCTNLIVVNQMAISVVSTATFSSTQQTEIHDNSSHGLWPFYCSGSGKDTTTTVTFDNNGAMTVRITSLPNVPIVIGCTVLSAGEMLGGEKDTAEIMTARY